MSGMLPESVDYFTQDEQADNYEILPTRTYRVDTVNRRIIGTIDERDAVFQFIQKVLDTSKYAYEIYDWYYGNELKALVGKPYDYICAEIPRIVREALMTDDRIKDCRKFEFKQLGIDSMQATWVVDTVYGELEYSQEVKI